MQNGTHTRSAGLYAHNTFVPLQRDQRRRDLKRHPRIQNIALAPLVRLFQPLLTLQHLRFGVHALKVLLVPDKAGHFVVCAGVRPVGFEMTFELVPVDSTISIQSSARRCKSEQTTNVLVMVEYLGL